MLIKEYRIALPLTVDEYRIAQLYMIAKKSRDESSGAGSGVEILVNEPYTDGPGGAGQYTHKIFHVGNRLPGWLKALLPKSALIVYEKAWNAYPYTKTRYTCPFVEKFFLEIETKYLNDPGNHENIFELSGSDLRSRIVDMIDVVKEHPHGEEFKTDEDPRSYVSQKTGRGPLTDSWMEDYWAACRDKPTPLPDGRAIMCAYKLCRVEFKYWGMQSKIERFIHDVALRKTMLEAHRQAWAWQDEWWGLTMEDIRQLEKETQEALARTMAAATQADGTEGDGTVKTDVGLPAGGAGTSATGEATAAVAVTPGSIEYAVQDSASRLSCSWSPANSPRRPRKPRDLHIGGGNDPDPDTYSNTSADVRQRIWSRSNSRAGLHSPGCTSNKSFDLQLANWRMEGCVRHSDSSSDDEFFDCEEDVDTRSTLTKWSSLEFFNEDEGTSPSVEYFKDDSIFKPSFVQRSTSAIESSQVRKSRAPAVGASASLDLDLSLPCSPALSPTHHHHPLHHLHPHHSHQHHSHPSHLTEQQPCPTSVLLLVLHGGSILDSVVELATKKSDVSTFRTALEGVARQHYPAMAGHVTIRLVACPQICQEALGVLSSLSPYSFDASSSPFTFDGGSAGNTSTGVQDFIPVSAIPLFATASIEYNEIVSRVIASANQAYHDFLRSDAGNGFHGQVALLGDSVGSVVAYDALCRPNQYGRFGSDSSLQETTAPETPHSPGGQHSSVKENPLISISDGNNGHGDARSGVASAATADSHAVGGDAAHLTAPHFRRRSSCSSEQSHVSKFDFDVSDFFMFGSPVAMVMAFRKIHTFDDKNTTPPRPVCSQVYNLFHPMDPLAARLEPLISARFSQLQPVKVARYAKYPLGDGQPCHLLECIQSNAHHFVEYGSGVCPATPNYSNRRMSEASMQSIISGVVESVPLQAVSALTQKWWGNKRLDYALYCPEGLTNFPVNALPHLFHASYWESSDVIAFILRQVSRSDSGLHRGDSDKDGGNFTPSQPREKWIKKRTSMKLKNVNANHRANDVIIREGVSQVLNARFMYGPLDMVTLTGEKVDIHIMKDPPSGEWIYLGTEVTDNSGRLRHVIPDKQAFGYGMYPIKMVVRGDHTSVDFYLVVIPPKTECVVFSIDGSFTASVSVTGRDPKVRAGAVDVVRHWQELGYLIVYVTGRPDMQQQKVVSWLAQHNFPRGLLSFVDGFCTDPLRHKADYLRHLVHDADVTIHASYGSSKDISMYTAIGLKPEQIFIVGKASKKQHAQAQILSDGYAAHLSDLLVHGGSRQALGNARMVIPRGCFGLPGQMVGLRRRRSAKRTTSYPITATQGPVPLVEAILRPRGTSPRPSTGSVVAATANVTTVAASARV